MPLAGKGYKPSSSGRSAAPALLCSAHDHTHTQEELRLRPHAASYAVRDITVFSSGIVAWANSDESATLEGTASQANQKRAHSGANKNASIHFLINPYTA